MMKSDSTFLTKESDFEIVRKEWKNLEGNPANPHLVSSIDWFDAWRHIFGNNKKIGILRVADAGKLIALQSLMVEPVWRGPALSAIYDYTREDTAFLTQLPQFRFLPVRQLSGLITLESGNIRSLPLFANTEITTTDLELYAAALRKIPHWDVARLVCKRSEIESYLHALDKTGYTAYANRHGMPLYAMHLKPWEVYLSGRSRNFRKNFRHAVQQVLSENKNFTARTYMGNNHVEPALDLLAGLAQKSWKCSGREGESIIVPLTDRALEFHRRLCLTPSSKILPYVQLLFDGDNPFAGTLSYFYGQRLLGCQMYFDPEYERFSPGRLLLKELITHGQAEGATIFDLNGGSPFVQYFSDFADDYYQIMVFNTGWYARMLHFWARKFSNDIISLKNVSSLSNN